MKYFERKIFLLFWIQERFLNKLFVIRVLELSILFSILTQCVPQIYKDSPGFIGLKDRSKTKTEYFPENAKYLGFKENFNPDLNQFRQFSNLESLEISSPELKDLSQLGSLKTIQYLNLSGKIGRAHV